MKVHYYTAPCGAGKSYQAAQRTINIPGRYLVVRDRVEAIHEHHRMLYKMSVEAGRMPSINPITSKRGSSVRLEVEQIPERYNALPHVIVLITHKAMLMCDFSAFEGWHIIIDETPVVLDKQELKTARSVDFFQRHYQLDDAGHKAWRSVRLTREGWDMTGRDLEDDDCLKLLRVFHERVTAATPLPDDATARHTRRSHKATISQSAVIQNLKDWDDMADGRTWTWWSLWSPKQLAAFQSVEFMANGFEHSATFAFLKSMNPDVEWVEVPLTSTRTFAQRSVHIEYFAEQHVASKSLFETAAGQSYLTQIAQYLKHRNQIWMANDNHAASLVAMGGTQLRPQQAGSNQYSGYHAAACIYAAKPSQETRAVMGLMNVDPDIWTRSYEHEAILQFACRTSIRDPQSTAPVTITVYDRDQADYLRTYFEAQPHAVVSMQLVDLGFAQVRRAAGRPALELSGEERDAKIAADKLLRAAAARQRRAREKKEKEKEAK